MNHTPQDTIPGIDGVLHPTDFTEGSRAAFHHALMLAFMAKTPLTLMPAVHCPEVPGWDWKKVILPHGNVIDGIVETASKLAAGLIVMATDGRHGFLDALRGTAIVNGSCGTLQRHC